MEGTEEGGKVALELVDDADVGVDGTVDIDDWVCMDEVARFIVLEGGEVTCKCDELDEDDAIGGCCCCSWWSCCRGEETLECDNGGCWCCG